MGYGQDTNDFILFSLLAAEKWKSTIKEAKANPRKEPSQLVQTYLNL
jgi:hypothetical protein